MQWLRSLVAFAALALALLLGGDDADARVGGGAGLGGKAEGLMMAPAGAAPKLILAAVDHPAAGQTSGSLGGLFNRGGVIGGFAAGFLGSGPLGLLFGHGLIGELNGVAAVVGLMFQLTLIAMLCWLIWSWWTGRNQPAFSGLSPRQLADPYLRTRHEAAPAAEPSTDGDDCSGANRQHSAKA